MKSIVLKFGLISGVILASLTALMLPLFLNGTLDSANSQLIGYTSMLLSFIMVFFAIRTYRENVGGGTITFGRAFKVGILVTLITSAVYVVAWEIVYFNFLPDFADRYAALTVDEMRRKGESEEKIAAAQEQMAKFKELYKNPLFNVGITFLEVFPVGLVVTLVSAGILRKRTPDAPLPAQALA